MGFRVWSLGCRVWGIRIEGIGLSSWKQVLKTRLQSWGLLGYRLLQWYLGLIGLRGLGLPLIGLRGLGFRV